MRSPYFASKPPALKSTFSTMSLLMTERPSCCPLLMSSGRYTSTPLIYTQFSSKEPPRTLYWLDSSLCVLTPACVATSSSTALPVVLGMRFRSFVLSCCVVPICRRESLTTTSPISLPRLRSPCRARRGRRPRPPRGPSDARASCRSAQSVPGRAEVRLYILKGVVVCVSLLNKRKRAAFLYIPA